MLRLGFRDLERNLLLNVLVVMLLMIAFATVISGTSAVVGRMRLYNRMRPYLEKPGVFLWSDILTYGEDNYMYKDSEELRQYLSGVQNVLSVTKWLGTSYQGTELNVWEYSQEVIDMLSPEMEQGRYFTKQDIYSSTLKGVISKNVLGIKTGDVVRIDDDMVKGCYQDIEIIGVMDDGVTLYQPEYYGEYTEDYRQCFQPYNMEQEEGKPVILVAGQQILANQSKGLFPKVNFRLSDLGFLRQISGPVIITYENGTSQGQVDNDMATFSGSATSIIRQYSLQEFNENSKKYVFEEAYNLLPILICSIVFILIAVVSAGVVSVKKNMHNYAIYYICGLSWKKCARVSLYSSIILTLGAFCLVNVAFGIMYICKRLEGTFVSFGLWQVIVCVAIGIVFVMVGWLMPMLLIRKTSANQILRNHQ